MLDEKNLRVAIRCLYDNRHTGYWTYPILLSDTFDSRTKALNLTHDEASMVFSVCEDLEFLKKVEGDKLISEGREYTKYRVNYAKLREYYRFSHPHFYYHWFPDCVIYTLEKYGKWILAAIALILTSFFSGWMGAIGEGLAK